MKTLRFTATAAAIAALLLAAWATGARAAQPLVTQDADVLERSACQWDYFRENARAGELKANGWTTQVGCGVGANTQLDVGFSRVKATDIRSDAVYFTGKTNTVKREGNGVGVSVVYGVIGLREAGNDLSTESMNVGLAFTKSFGSTFTGHANLGWLKIKDDESRLTWGVAGELAVGHGVELLAETFGEDGSRPWMALGARWALSETASVNASYAVQRDTPRLKLTTVGVMLNF